MNTVFARNIAIENRHVASIKGQARRHSLLSLAMMLFGCGIIAGCGSKPSTVATVAQRKVPNPTVETEASREPINPRLAVKPAQPDLVVDAQTLLDAYAMDRNANDRAHAEAIYGNRTIVVKGTVQTILFELVTIGSREDFDRSDTGGIRSPNILCFDLSTEEAATLHKGKEILIAGQVELGNSGGIWLYKCKLR